MPDQLGFEVAARALLAVHWLLCAHIHIRYPEATVLVIARVARRAAREGVSKALGAYMALVAALVAIPGVKLGLLASLPLLALMLAAHKFWEHPAPYYRAAETASFAKTLGVAAATLALIAF